MVPGDELVDTTLPGHRPLEQRQDAGQQAAERQLGKRQDHERRPLVGPFADLWRRLVARVGIPQVVESDAQRARQPSIASPVQNRRESDGDLRRVAARQAIDQLASAKRFFTIRGEMDSMSAVSQRGDHRLEIPEVGEVTGDEQHIHGTVTTPLNALSGSMARRSATAKRPAPRRW